MTDIPATTLRSGGAMPLLGFGTWQTKGDAAYRAVTDALEVGYRHLDTATMYGNEAEVGRALRDSGLNRSDLFVTTKLPADRADQARETLQASLDALGVDQLDLWLVHWPPDNPSPAVWETMIAARNDGLTRAIGVSNYDAKLIDDLIDSTGEAPEVNQIEWSPALYDADVHAQHRERGIVLEGYSPFRASNLRDKTLRAVAEAHDVTVPQVIVRWHLEHEIVVIPKSARRERIEANADVFGFTLTDDEMRSVDALGTAGR
jgi:diketogulonate reductase-like aldo/keto reductase